MPIDLPLLLLPGMAADARLFQSQIAQFPKIHVPTWIDPHPRESLRAYAARFARVIDPGVPCIVGGASFGGVVALEMTPYLRTVACVLIGSIRSPAELSWRWRVWRPLGLLGPDGLRVAARLGVEIPWLQRGTIRRLNRLASADAAFARWAMCAVLRWQPNPMSRRVPVFQLHGERDDTLPVTNSKADTIVRGGAHALSLFNSSEVNAYLRAILEWAGANRD